MTEREFNVQILSTEAQWRSGLTSGLKLDAGGLTLFANAAFESLFSPDSSGQALGDIVTDECGQTYWTEQQIPSEGSDAQWALMRHDPISNRVERVLWLNPVGALDPRKLWLSCDYLFVLDEAARRVLALSRDNYQPLFEIPGVDSGEDIDFDGSSAFYALQVSNGPRICRYPLPPAHGPACFDLKLWQQPVALALGPGGRLYIVDAELGRFIRYSPADKSEELLGEGPDPRLLGIQPSAVDIDPRGVIFVATSQPAHLFQFDADGSFLGETALPEGVETISGIGFDRGANVYLATNLGVARFSLAITPVGQSGAYYSRTLDNGSAEGLWHGLTLDAELPPKAAVEVRSFASSDEDLKRNVDNVFASHDSPQTKVANLERLLGTLWNNPAEIFAGAVGGAAAPDMLFLRNKGRYLWVKLGLVTFDQQNRPSIRKARIHYPRLSYLRYLPPAYRDDPVSAAFLERFLALFETVFRGVEEEVDAVFRYFDSGFAPAAFLPWLGSWVNLSFDEELPVERVRRLIQRSPVLFQRKGTPAGLSEFLEIYTGKPVSLLEYSQSYAPLVLGAGSRLGIKTQIVSSSTRAYRVGDSSIVGYGHLRARDGDPAEPFQMLSQRFEVVLNIDADEFQARSATLRRIVDEQKPAHTSAVIRVAAERAAVGQAQLGLNAMAGGAKPYQVGVTRLGEGAAFGTASTLRLERGAWIGSKWKL